MSVLSLLMDLSAVYDQMDVVTLTQDLSKSVSDPYKKHSAQLQSSTVNLTLKLYVQ